MAGQEDVTKTDEFPSYTHNDLSIQMDAAHKAHLIRQGLWHIYNINPGALQLFYFRFYVMIIWYNQFYPPILVTIFDNKMTLCLFPVRGRREVLMEGKEFHKDTRCHFRRSSIQFFNSGSFQFINQITFG